MRPSGVTSSLHPMAKAPARIQQQTPHATSTSVEQTAPGKKGTETSRVGEAALRDRTPLPTPRTETPGHSKPEPLPPLKNDPKPWKNLK